MKTFLFNAITLSLLCLLPWLQTKAADEHPNIIVILVDDMGYSDIGCYGGEIPTPNIDSLAHNGLRFRQFYNSARCCPTRASLLTGVHPHQTGIGHMSGKGHNVSPNYQGQLMNSVVQYQRAIITYRVK